MLRRFVANLMQMMAKEARKRTAAEEDGALATVAAAADGGLAEPKKAKLGKKTTFAMLLSYQGHNYYGMQIQSDSIQHPTIESHIMDAMLKHNFITEEQRADPYPWHFQRCARTDRRVSAVRQIVSMQLRRDERFVEEGVSLLNSLLPEDIRVFGIKRVTPSFHAQKTCDGRTYSYTLPTFAFAACDELTTDAYRITPERIAEVDELLSIFLGTHNFFNYTSGLEHQDQRSKRHIISFKCEKPFLYMDPVRNREVEFISLYIHGQSFMLHQIRKMIGTIISIMRGFMYKSDIVRSFQADRMDIPRAPGLGLLLEKLHFTRFETRFGESHGSVQDWGESVETALQEFRDRLIVQRILREECETQSMMMWLSSLTAHQFLLDPMNESTSNTSALAAASKLANSAAYLGKLVSAEQLPELEEDEEEKEVAEVDEEEPVAAPVDEIDEKLEEDKPQGEFDKKLLEGGEVEEEEEVKVKVAAGAR